MMLHEFRLFTVFFIVLLMVGCGGSNSPDETTAGDEPLPVEETPPVVEDPTEPPIVEDPTEPPVVEDPTEPPVVEDPTEPPVVEDPTEPPLISVALNISDVTVPDDAAEPVFTITLTAASTEIVRVSYETRDGTAIAGTDYVAETGLVEFDPGETVQHIDVELLKTEFATTVSFDLLLSSPENAELADATGTATLLATEVIEPVPDEPMLEESVFNPLWGDLGVFSDAGQCARCHQASDAAPTVMTVAGEDVSSPTQWQHGMMAHSLNDPYYQAVVADEVKHFPHLAGFVEDTCLTCHAPMAHTHAHQTQTSLDTDGFYRLDTAVNEMPAREGVSCTACHQIEDDGKLGTVESFSGNFSISDNRREIFGPYANPVTQPMINNTQYTPVQGNHISSSEHCATCHTLFTPTISVNDGQLTGEEFPEQTPYLEWQNSIYADGNTQARSCQQCHMPEPVEGYETRIALRPNGTENTSWPERSPFSVHEFVGGNTHTLTVLRDYRDVMGIAGSTTVDGFNEKIIQTRNLLKAAASVEIGTPALETNQLNIPVTISNLTGHKLPTSYPSRRMWLQLTVTDKDGQLIFESGRADAKGRLSVDTVHLQAACVDAKKDLPDFDYQQCYEPHRDVISSPEQIAIYESVLGDVNGNISYVLLHAAEYLKDNRIPPKGFNRGDVPTNDVTAIIGAATADTDFNAESATLGSGQDTVHYQVDVNNHSGPYQIEAKLLYQSIRPGFVKSLHAEDHPRIARYKQMYEAVPPTVELIAEDAAAL